MKPPATIWSLAGMALLFLCVDRASAAVFIIADGDVAGLISAINTANSNGEADTIILATNGHYVLTTIDNTTHGPSGLPVVVNDNSHLVLISGNGSTIRRDPAAPAFRIFTIAGHTQIDQLTISNGSNGGGNSGGGIYDVDTSLSISLTLNNCTLSGNFATFGGGLATNQNNVQLSGCTLVGNSAQNGGAINNNEGSVELHNCTLTGNTASSVGAAILSFGGLSGNAYIYLTSCTLNNNGIFLDGADATTYIALGNCIFNQSPLAYQLSGNGFLTTADQGYNLSSGDPGNSFFYQATDQINTDPGLDPAGLQNNGGPTQTIALTFGSAAIDKGKIFFNLTTDQRGVARPYDNSSIPNASGGDGSDIGAYEAPQDPVQGGPFLVVVNYGDHDDGVCSGADCTLREAINRANAVPGANTIGFTHLGGSVTLTMGELAVTDSIAIYGNGNVTVSGNGASRIFDFTGGDSTLNYLTIRDGFNQINIFIGIANAGGGIFNSATLHVNGCWFANNHVVGGFGFGSAPGGAGEGGAIYNSGTLYVDGSAFTQTNEAFGGTGGNSLGRGGSGRGGYGQGGALFNDTAGSLTLTNCTFSQNMAVGGNGGSGGTNGGDGGNGSGGAIYNLGTMTVMSATIDGNSGSSGTPGTGTANGVPGLGSGGVAVAGGTATMTNNIIAGNIGSNGGGNDVDGAFMSNGYNLIGTANHSTGFGPPATADQLGTDLNPIDPKLFALQNNVMLLRRDSPALDKGKSVGLTTDQRGQPRPVDTVFGNASGGDGADIGAVEMNLFGGPDTDHDGMSDDFEIVYGFNPNDPTDASGDLDHDGMTNLQEFQAGSDPRDPTSYFRITSVAKTGNDFTAQFSPAVRSKTYRLERKNSLSITGQVWNPVIDFSPTFTGSGQISDLGGAAGTQDFYRVRILP